MVHKERGRRLQRILPLLAVLIALITGFFYGRQAELRVEQQVYRVAMDSAKEQITLLDTALQGCFTTLEAYAKSLVVDDFAFDSPQTLSRLGSAVDGNNYFYLFLIDQDGRCHTATGQTALLEDRAYRARGMAGERAIQKIEADQTTGNPCIVLSVPIQKGEQTVGVLAGAFSEAFLSNLLISEAYNRMSYSFVCDSQGNVIIESNHTLFSNAQNILDALKGDAIRSGGTEEILAADLAAGRDGSVRYTYDGVERFAVYRKTGINDWMLFDVVPSSEIDEAVAGATHDFYTVVLLLAVLAGVMLLLQFMNQKSNAKALRRERADFHAAATQSGKMLRIYRVKDNRLVNTYGETQLMWRDTPEAMVESGIVAPETADAYLAFYQAIRAGQDTGSNDARIQNTQGVFRWYHADFSMLRNERGEPDHAIITVWDCTAQKQRTLEYAHWNDTVNALVAQSAAYIQANLTQNRIEKVFGELSALDGGEAGQTLDALFQNRLVRIADAEDVAVCQEFLRRDRLMMLYFNGVVQDSAEYRSAASNDGGQMRWYRVTASMTSRPDSQDIELIITYADIEREKKEQLRLLALAQRDSMTGLYNHEATHEKIAQILAACAPDRPVAMFMIDLDNFKQINDLHGHQSGDAFLQRAARTIAEQFTDRDVV